MEMSLSDSKGILSAFTSKILPWHSFGGSDAHQAECEVNDMDWRGLFFKFENVEVTHHTVDAVRFSFMKPQGGCPYPY